MYGYDYEYDVLALLRILKYIQLYRADEFEKARDFCKQVEPSDAADELAWGTFDQALAAIDGETGEELRFVNDRLFNRFFDLNLKCLRSGNTSKWEPVRKKLFDMAAYYLCSCDMIFDVDVLYYTGGITLKVILSLDFYEPFELANAVVDFLLALRQEIAVLEKQLGEQTAEIIELPQTTQEQEAA